MTPRMIWVVEHYNTTKRQWEPSSRVGLTRRRARVLVADDRRIFPELKHRVTRYLSGHRTYQ